MLKIADPDGGMTATLDDLAREGARRMLEVALEAEVAAYIMRPLAGGTSVRLPTRANA